MEHFKSMLIQIMDAGAKVLKSETSTLFLYEKATDELTSSVIQDSEIAEIRIPADKGIAGKCFMTGETVNVGDVRKESSFHKGVDKESGFVTRSLLAVPVFNPAGDIIGVIEAINKLEGGSFNEEDERKLKKFSKEITSVVAKSQKKSSLISGLALVIGLATLATLFHRFMLTESVRHGVSVVLVAILTGLIVNNAFNVPIKFVPGIRFALHSLLRFAIVLLGAQITFKMILDIGTSALIIIPIIIGVAFTVAHLLGRMAKISTRLATLIAMGTAICGNSAIAATAATIKANEDELSLAITINTLIGTTAMFIYPFIGRYFGFDDTFFGMWSGLAVNDTAQVYATSIAYSQAANEVATTVKLTRNAFLGIMVVGVGVFYARWVGGQIGGKKVSFKARLKQSVPLFLVGFLVMAFLNTAGVFDWITELLGRDPKVNNITGDIKVVSKYLIVGALTGVGLGTKFSKVKEAGLAPVILGVVVAICASMTAIFLLRVLT